MEDRLYVDNLLRERACPVCGTDRKARRSPKAETCGVCGERVTAEDAMFAIARGGARAACSMACLEKALHGGLAGPGTCPMCGSPWREAEATPRSCAICGTALAFERGYAGLWRGARLQTFCGAGCLEAYLRRANPFCG